MSRKHFEWKVRGKQIQLGERTLIVGVLNVTPDSFSDGGKYEDPDRAFALYTRAAELGEPMALINLAICHEGGVGTPVNAEKALELRRKAAAPPPK